MSSSSNRKLDVFLCFEAEETIRNFVSHLRCSLNRRGLTPLGDENELRGGDSDPSVVDRTTGKSKVAVILVSGKYASSPSCLESLVKILRFHHSGSLAVIPVFYEIDISDVRTQSGKLCEPFSLLEREYSAKVQTWRQALSQLTDIPGGHYSEISKGDAELIGKITDDIWGMLVGSKSSDLCGLVGMDRHMKYMYRLLDLGLKDQVRWIQILGRQGIGKTELAKYMYEEILHQFDTHLWLDIPERPSRGDYDGDFTQEWRSKIWGKLVKDKRARLLLVLDNVDETDHNHIYDLERELDSLGPGSRIIITTRKKKYLGISQLDLEYEVVDLDFPQALQLFCLHAFEQTHPSLGFEELSCRAVTLTGGSPSIIKKLASVLSGRDTYEWEAKLSRYERYSARGIVNSNEIILSKHSSIMDSVSSQSSTKNYSYGLVGMGRHMQAVNRLLESGYDNRVRVVGIWGTGGIGKTTLARYAYEEISQEFHTHVFIENAQDHSCLEEQFLSKAIEKEAFAVRNSKDAIDVMKSGLCHQNVLLIVDGVDNSRALKEVHKIASWFYRGSRVIVTTKDESLLLTNGVQHVYEVKCLRFPEALQLFYQFALKQKSPSDRFKQLSIRAIKLVGFLPLALKVTGSMLYGKDEKYWETILQSFEAKQDKG